MRLMAFSCSSGESPQRSVPAEIRMGARILFKSWAMPVARVPMPSMRWRAQELGLQFFLFRDIVGQRQLGLAPVKHNDARADFDGDDRAVLFAMTRDHAVGRSARIGLGESLRQ